MNRIERAHLYAGMGISIAGTYTTFYPQWLNYFTVLMMCYLTIGCFLDKGSLFVHHLICFSCFSFRFIYFPGDDVPFHSEMIRFICCEYSTFFYNGWPILDDIYRPDLTKPTLMKYVKYAFDAGFVVCFVKYRVWDIGTKIIFNPDSYAWQPDAFANKTLLYAHYNLSLFAFYALNLYWFGLIVKKAAKLVLRDYNSYLLCESFARYSGALPLVFAAASYYRSNLFDIPAVIHCQSLFYLAGGSWLYHRSLYLKIKRNGESIDCLEGESGDCLKYDVVGLNIQTLGTFLCCSWKYVFKLQYIGAMHVLFIAVCCGTSCYMAFNYINTRVPLMCDENKNRYYLHSCINFPSVLGSLSFISLLVFADHSFSETISTFFLFLTIYWVKILIVKIEPLYKLSHLALHVALAWHHYILAEQVCKSRIGGGP